MNPYASPIKARGKYEEGKTIPDKIEIQASNGMSEDEYANQKLDDSFLLALADGGFQVGELAKLYFLGGHDIKSLDYQKSH